MSYRIMYISTHKHQHPAEITSERTEKDQVIWPISANVAADSVREDQGIEATPETIEIMKTVKFIY